ncbi:TPA: hypothetical protein N2D16_002844 [Clostridium botulinum]|nr:hypothetical protein [Clostridium botulinum]HCL4455220.1 hypothetical protein [Clostridium botulinum]
MFVLKSFKELIRDCDEEYQILHVEILNNGNVKVWMFEDFKEDPDIIPINCLKDLETFSNALNFQALIDIATDNENILKVDKFIKEVFNEHRKLYSQYNFSNDGLEKYIKRTSYKNQIDCSNALFELQLDEEIYKKTGKRVFYK